MSRQENKDYSERYSAVLLGCAIGDALGMPVEGWKKEQIKKYVGRVETFLDPVIPEDTSGIEITRDEYGPVKCWNRDNKRGQYTDDTILTLALANSLAKHGTNLEEIAKGQLQEYLDRLLPDGYVVGGFGGTTKEAFQNLIKGVPPTHSGVIGGPGNAPAMKMSPMGIYMHCADVTDSLNYFAMVEQTAKISKITHRDPRSVVSGVVHAVAIYSLLKDCSRDQFVDEMEKICRYNEEPLTPEYNNFLDGNLTSRFQWIAAHRNEGPARAHKEIKSTSNVYHSYPFAVFMFQKYWDDPITGLIETVNYGGDCDTTGAMYGTMIGARFGNIFPKEWVDGLVGKAKILKIASELSKHGA